MIKKYQNKSIISVTVKILQGQNDGFRKFVKLTKLKKISSPDPGLSEIFAKYGTLHFVISFCKQGKQITAQIVHETLTKNLKS